MICLRISSIALALHMILMLATPAQALGDRIIPQVADGIGGDGTVFRTKFSIINISSYYSIKKAKVLFFQQNGSPWIVDSNYGTTSEIPLDLGYRQTVRIETLGRSGLASGYAVVQNLENATEYPEDHELAITVYYEVLRGPSPIDTVSVPVGEPTGYFRFPVDIEVSQELLTGFAVVNLADTSNSVQLDLYRATDPSSQNATRTASSVITLGAKQQRALFLNSAQLFPSLSSFKGMLEGYSLDKKPVAILALLQTPTPTGVQYATLAPVYVDGLIRNSTIDLPMGFPLDADLATADYFGKNDWPWDLLYDFNKANLASRGLVAKNGAKFAVIGVISYTQFDNAVNPEYLRGLTYNLDQIDLSDGSSNLRVEFAFAIKTNLGRYAKVWIRRITTETKPDGIHKDLGLNVFVYR